MSGEELSFLDETPEVEEPEAETQEEASDPPVEEEAQAEPEAEGTGEPLEPETPDPVEAAPPVADKENVGTVPLTVVLDEREKRQRAEQEAQELRKWREQQEAAQRQAQQQAPDWFDDPQAAAQHQTQMIQQQMLNAQLNQSQFLAERDYGKELVAETEAYFRANPQAKAQFQNHPSPWHGAVAFYQKQKILDEIGADPEAFKEKLREEGRAQALGRSQPVQQKPTAPPPSMATAPSAGKADAISPGNTFDDMFSA